MANDTLVWIPGRAGVKPLTPHRPIKLQICLSTEERARLEKQARAAGFESVGAYVRARTVNAPDNGAA